MARRDNLNKGGADNNISSDGIVTGLFSRDSTCSQREVDEFFRNKPTLTVRHVGVILESSVGMKKRRRVDVLKKIHLEHITDELRRLHQGSQKLNAFEITSLAYGLQATTKDDAQTSGV